MKNSFVLGATLSTILACVNPSTSQPSKSPDISQEVGSQASIERLFGIENPAEGITDNCRSKISECQKVDGDQQALSPGLWAVGNFNPSQKLSVKLTIEGKTCVEISEGNDEKILACSEKGLSTIKRCTGTSCTDIAQK
jgi:hypothetical protein